MKSYRVLFNGLALAALVAALLVVPATAQEPGTTAPEPLAGRASYLENCAPCHGETGQGDGPSASGLGVTPAALGDFETASAKSLAEWFDITKNGNMQRMMPPWGNRLDDQQIWNTVAYAWSLHTSGQELDQGRQVYDANCASCHGPDGAGAQPGAPDLTDFEKTSAVSQATWTEAVANGKGTMPAFAGKLSDEEQRASLAYVRSLSFGGPLVRDALAKGAGVISGTVTNSTTGAPVPNLEVGLGIFDESSLLEERSTQTDASGGYSFGELPTDPGLAFVVRAEYPQGIPYSSEVLSFESGEEQLDAPLSVFETTTDPSGVRAERVHYIVEFDGGRALVAELWLFSQDGDRAYAGDDTGVLRFPLPAGAQDLGIDGDDGSGRFRRTEDGFVDMMPLQPGQNVRQVLFRYALPYSGDSLDLVHTLPYDATNVNALISDAGQQVSSEELVTQGVRPTQNGNYVSLVGQNLPAGKQVVVRMTGLPSTSGGAGGTDGTAAGGLSRGLLFALIGLAAVAAVMLVALPIMRNRGAAPALSSEASRDDLVTMLARLDLAFEAGQLSESAYRDERLRLKAQLRDLVRKEGAA